MKSLVIAEKPSVAKDIAKVLRVPAKGEVFENEEYVISSAVGHLVSLCDPDDYDEKLKRWSRKTLPILPKTFKIKASSERGAKDQFNKLKKLMERKDVETVVNACDAGREGELIFAYIYDLAKCAKPTQRLWLTSMTADAIRDSFKHLLGGNEKFNLCEAARCRAESDWLIGMNGTRAVTLRTSPAGKGQVATVGRVQTPTLSLIVQRELDIRNFTPTAYWRIVGEFGVSAGTYEGVYQRPDFKKSDKKESSDGNAEAADKADRVWNKKTAEEIYEACRNAAAGTVTEEKKHTTEACQRLYDLTTLQREANKRFGFPATKTLQIAQALYEKHKATTYPRTDARALPEDYIPTCYRTLSALEVRGNVSKFAARVSENKWVRPNKRIFNNKEISDHFAIIPTDQPPHSLQPDEEKIYDMVVRRFIAVFFPPAEFDVTTRMTNVSGHNFKTEGKVLVVPGWKEVYGRDEGKPEDNLPAISDADGVPASAKINEIQLQEESTKPPARYTEATLLAAMESAGKFVEDEELALAMKERGLGTPATRAGIIDHIIKTKYVERAGRDLVPTIKAEQLMAFLKVVDVDILTSPAMTGEWEFRLQEVADGKRSRADFMKDIVDLTSKIVEKVGGDGGDDQWTETDVISPTDGKPMQENYRLFRSQDSVDVKGRAFPSLVIYKNASGHNLTVDEVRELISKGEIGPISDFKSRFGKPFTATLKLEKNENGLTRSTFVFPEREGDAEAAAFDYSSAPVIGECPVTKLKIYDTPFGFRPNPKEITKEIKVAPFSMAKKMLGTEITREQVQKLLTEGKTDLIKGFISNRTKRAFDAFLTLGKNSTKMRFEFPPREAKPKAEGAAAKKTPTKKRSLLKKPASGAGIKRNDDTDIDVG